jgi:hypothetical protein
MEIVRQLEGFPAVERYGYGHYWIGGNILQDERCGRCGATGLFDRR